LLTWRVEGEVIITDQPAAPRLERALFRLEPPLRLVLERQNETFVYERVTVQRQVG
jgi:hypothetical protein